MNNKIHELYETFARLNSAEDAEAFLTDICSEKEICLMAQRLQAAKLLLAGTTYKVVMEQTAIVSRDNPSEKIKISSTTLRRITKCIQQGSGYNKFLK
ncbi:MAG: Trp family transcriptional regulator [Firmicutes bacterium]|nr:Trp family transcriptional regulator [Bacillota bacterium]